MEETIEDMGFGSPRAISLPGKNDGHLREIREYFRVLEQMSGLVPSFGNIIEDRITKKGIAHVEANLRHYLSAYENATGESLELDDLYLQGQVTDPGQAMENAIGSMAAAEKTSAREQETEESGGITLTPHQQEVLQRAVAILENHNRLLIQGMAGVGKTTLINFLIKKLTEKNRKDAKAIVLAPTNKAVSVVRGKMRKDDDLWGMSEQENLHFATIHSALGYTEHIDEETGERTFRKDVSKGWEGSTANQKAFASAGLVIIDESSMIHSTLLNEINQTVNGFFKKKAVFLGDPKQIPPVGEIETPTFKSFDPSPEQVVELTEIVRQVQGNPIITLSRNLDRIPYYTPNMVGGMGYTFTRDTGAVLNMLAKNHETPDEVRFLSFYNRKVQDMNSKVRARIYGNPDKVMSGEILIIENAEPNSGHYANQEVKVEKLSVENENFQYQFGPLYNIKGESIDKQNRKKSGPFPLKYYLVNNVLKVVHEDSEKDFDNIKKEIIGLIKSGKEEKNNEPNRPAWDKMYWQGYYDFVLQFTQISYTHALTIHKSQGSTYRTAIIDMKSIQGISDLGNMRERLYYTAVTRASEKVIFTT